MCPRNTLNVWQGGSTTAQTCRGMLCYFLEFYHTRLCAV